MYSAECGRGETGPHVRAGPRFGRSGHLWRDDRNECHGRTFHPVWHDGRPRARGRHRLSRRFGRTFRGNEFGGGPAESGKFRSRGQNLRRSPCREEPIRRGGGGTMAAHLAAVVGLQLELPDRIHSRSARSVVSGGLPAPVRVQPGPAPVRIGGNSGDPAQSRSSSGPSAAVHHVGCAGIRQRGAGLRLHARHPGNRAGGG